MFCVIYVTVNIQNVLLWLEFRHGDVCATGRWHCQLRSISLQLTHQSDATSNHLHPAFFLVGSMPQIL